jgi:pimeloyl-ACP methyl ester carboxylesterase
VAQAQARESQPDPRSTLLAAMPVTERRIQCAGISTSVLEGGAGTSVLLLHGPFGYAAHWLRVIPQLTKSYHVLAPDLPDHGASDAQGVLLSADHMIAWLDELIQKTCTSPVILVAQTVSGAMALRLAISNGARMKRLVLVDTFGLSAFEPEPEFASALQGFAAGPSEHTHERMWEQCAFDLKKTRTRMGAYWKAFEAYNLDRARSPATLAAVDTLVQQFGLALPQERLARITVPTALIWGLHDRATNVRVAAAASARYGWPLTIIDDCADDPAIEQPEAFLKALHGFLGVHS